MPSAASDSSYRDEVVEVCSELDANDEAMDDEADKRRGAPAPRARRRRLMDSVTEAIGAAMLERLHACPLGQNRVLVGEADATHEAIELELDASPSSPSPSPVVSIRRVTEMAMELCADGHRRGGRRACPRPLTRAPCAG